MAQVLTASVTNLAKYDKTYTVRVMFSTEGPSYELDIITPCSDPVEAIEAARFWFHHLGAKMAATLGQPGSLR